MLKPLSHDTLLLFSGDYSDDKLGDQQIHFSGASSYGVCFYSAIPYPSYAILAFYVGGWDDIWLLLRILDNYFCSSNRGITSFLDRFNLPS